MNSSSSQDGPESSEKDHSEEQHLVKSTLMFSQHFRVSIMVALITVTVMGGLSFLGYQLDAVYQTKPAFLIVGLVMAFPLSQLVVYKWVKKRYLPKITQKNHS